MLLLGLEINCTKFVCCFCVFLLELHSCAFLHFQLCPFLKILIYLLCGGTCQYNKEYLIQSMNKTQELKLNMNISNTMS